MPNGAESAKQNAWTGARLTRSTSVAFSLLLPGNFMEHSGSASILFSPSALPDLQTKAWPRGHSALPPHCACSCLFCCTFEICLYLLPHHREKPLPHYAGGTGVTLWSLYIPVLPRLPPVQRGDLLLRLMLLCCARLSAALPDPAWQQPADKCCCSWAAQCWSGLLAGLAQPGAEGLHGQGSVLELWRHLQGLTAQALTMGCTSRRAPCPDAGFLTSYGHVPNPSCTAGG